MRPEHAFVPVAAAALFLGGLAACAGARIHPDLLKRGAATAGEGVALRWLGTAGFELSIDARTILFDPFVSRPPLATALLGRLVPDEVTIGATFAAADLILIGHAHYEHLMDVASIAQQTGALVAGSRTACTIVVHMGLPADRCVSMRGGQRRRLRGVDVAAIGSRHAELPLIGVTLPGRRLRPPRSEKLTIWDAPAGQPLIWVVRAAGLTVVHNSSAGLPADATVLLRAVPEGADVLLPAIALREQTPGYARTLIAYLRPRVMVPHHWDDFFEPLDPTPDPERRADAARFAEEAEGATVRIPEPFEIMRWPTEALQQMRRSIVADAAAR